MELDPIKIAEDKKTTILDNITKAFEHKKFIRNYAMELNKEQIIADLYFKSKNLIVQYCIDDTTATGENIVIVNPNDPEFCIFKIISEINVKLSKKSASKII